MAWDVVSEVYKGIGLQWVWKDLTFDLESPLESRSKEPTEGRTEGSEGTQDQRIYPHWTVSKGCGQTEMLQPRWHDSRCPHKDRWSGAVKFPPHGKWFERHSTGGANCNSNMT
eukprot:Protomagalhaensia_sp_Gyna_25__5854@NODE_877_length_2481_cov_19_479115_g691_i0_p3_GENE_NODE_877_length_2481_cov_19_479115_g691_i0NODE_877_length_2481_cov_19_479115_g691_i0_p3_ORF_typecomplete_len113_score7_65_NODE_877_length_2481_cov_19_479115_g691_i09591297